MTRKRNNAILILMPIIRPELFEGGIYHVYNRGVAKFPIFISDEDYQNFLDIIRYLLVGFPPRKKDRILPHFPVTYKANPLSNGMFSQSIDLLGYCLMPNHFHLLVQLNKIEVKIKDNGRIGSFHTLPEFMRRLNITYSLKFNTKQKRLGPIYQGKYKVKVVPKDPDLLQVIRYIHLNPRVGNLVMKPANWKYSDYIHYVSDQLPLNRISKPNLILSYFNGKKRGYREFVEASIAETEGKRLQKYFPDIEE